jgi:hypothetical protein
VAAGPGRRWLTCRRPSRHCTFRPVNHYCTYFDRGFLIQGLALQRSIAAHDPGALLWVLALDDFTAETLRTIGDAHLRIVALPDLEGWDPALVAAKANRSRVEYYFTLSSCWPRWLLAANREIERVTYVDADMFFFASPQVIFEAMDAARASVLITAHRFPRWLDWYERHGKYNVGILSFRSDKIGRDCLDDWRSRCLTWCYDRLEGDKYADQKYLDAWPARLGSSLLVLKDGGVNLAPWNWRRHRLRVASNSSAVLVDSEPLVLFHFARFRPTRGDWWWHSGQLDYGVMPWSLRQAIHVPYWKALESARSEVAARNPGFDFPHRVSRGGRDFWRAFPLRVLFGSDWLRVGDKFISARLGFGQYSGQIIAKLRKIFFRA